MRTSFNPEALGIVLKSSTKTRGAKFTAVSGKTGTEFTFKLHRGVPKLFVFVETQYLKFMYLGFYTKGYIIGKRGVVNESPAAKAIAWILKQVEQQGDLSKVRLYHLGECIKCGRTLTDSTSIRYGLGPTCRGV